MGAIKETGSDDPKGLIREAYRIEGITEAECRSIFLDWALSVEEPSEAVARLIERHGSETDHPMTAVLREGLAPAPTRRRRGGRAARVQ